MFNNFFTIAIDTCNHEDWIEKCVESCANQNYDNFEIILVDAKSTDNTFTIVKKLESKFEKLKVFQNEIRQPQVANFIFLGKLAKKGSIIVSVDGDDWLKDDMVLNKLNNVYNSNNVWMTYGSYEEFPFKDVSVNYGSYPQEVITNNSFREHKWLASHLRTFRKELLLKIKKEDLMLDGNWFETTGDQAIMLPMLEMSGNKSKYISDVLYVYNVSNSSRDSVINLDKQIYLANHIRKMKKYKSKDKI